MMTVVRLEKENQKYILMHFFKGIFGKVLFGNAVGKRKSKISAFGKRKSKINLKELFC